MPCDDLTSKYVSLRAAMGGTWAWTEEEAAGIIFSALTKPLAWLSLPPFLTETRPSEAL